LGKHAILAVAFQDRSTNIFLVLDLVFFGAIKKLKATAPGEFGDYSMDNQVLLCVHSYEQTAASMTIRSSFRDAGFS
jgi:hypothetical protein